jgi:hypothetical protein
VKTDISPKDNKLLNTHLVIYYNYIRKKRYRKYEKGLVVVPPSGKFKKLYEYETPVMRLGIFDKPLTFKFLMENYGNRGCDSVPSQESGLNRLSVEHRLHFF